MIIRHFAPLKTSLAYEALMIKRLFVALIVLQLFAALMTFLAFAALMAKRLFVALIYRWL